MEVKEPMADSASDTNSERFECWAILELMGHRRLAGWLQEATIGGGSFLRIDVPSEQGTISQFYSPAAVYAITPCTEETAKLVARSSTPQPVSTWDLRIPRVGAGVDREAAEDDERW